jgi:hypothetical protein
VFENVSRNKSEQMFSHDVLVGIGSKALLEP